MTENEIKNTKEWFEDFIKTYTLSNQETIEFQKAVACLEELQQYRAIGTVEEIQSIKDQLLMVKDMCKDYYEIGTVDEFKALKEKNEPKKLNNSLEEDGKIGGYCPNCNGTVLIQKTFLRTSKGKCCDWCGQKIDWQ